MNTASSKTDCFSSNYKTLPTTADKMADRITEITAQIEDEKKTGLVSFKYDLGWTPETKETLVSGGDRRIGGDYWFVDSEAKVMDVKKIRTRIKEFEVEEVNAKKVLRDLPFAEQNKKNAVYVDLADKLFSVREKIKRLNGILINIQDWKPTNCYYGASVSFNTGKNDIKKHDACVEQALNDYRVFAGEINKRRGNPIRNITIRTRINGDGTRTLEASWDIHREQYTYPHFVREYDILPEFKFKGGVSIKSLADEEQKEKDEKEEKKKKTIEEKTERERVKAEKERLKKEKEDRLEEKRKRPVVVKIQQKIDDAEELLSKIKNTYWLSQVKTEDMFRAYEKDLQRVYGEIEKLGKELKKEMKK